MWWIGVAAGAIAVMGGAALIRYGLTFPPKRASYLSSMGVPVPPAPTDQRGTLVSCGAVVVTIGLIAMLVFFCIAMSG